MKRSSMIATTVIALGVVTGGSLALAKQVGNAENDGAAALTVAKVTLSQAISAAETQASGKAVKAELEGERGKTVFNVEVVTPDSKVFDVKVDATDGKVLSNTLDQADRAGEDDND